MARAWIFQASPERWDIDAMVKQLETINWRVPQHTGEIATGDAVMVWRAGSEAGVIAVGRVATSPRQMGLAPGEELFAQEPSEDHVQTRVVLRVRPVPYVSKADVAALPQLAGHQILTAPMGTVFPLSADQWAALAARVPDPPELPASADETAGLPDVFAWADRRKSVFPLPGGIESYRDSLNIILRHIADKQPERSDLDAWVSSNFGVSENRGRQVIAFLQRISLVRSTAARVELTAEAQRWIAEQDPFFLATLVHSRVQFIGELLVYLREPRSTDELLEHANDGYGMGWASRAQIDRRRQLLQGLGLIETDDEGRLTLTATGQQTLQSLTIQPPSEVPRASVERPLTDERREERTPITAPPPTEPPDPADRLHAIMASLETTKHHTTDPSAFEKAAAEAFAFLGFASSWLGGAGKTDILLVAELADQDRYRVIVDAKTTAREAVKEPQIDWETLDEHKERYEADYVALVAPAFHGGRIVDRATARGRRVTLLDVPGLASLCRQHASVPLGLDAYRLLFEADGTEAGIEAVGEVAEETRRWMVLTSEILRRVGELEGDEGGLRARDLYWNLEAFGERFGGATHEEIELVLQVLSTAPLGLLRNVDGTYRSLGSLGTAVQRVRLLADLMERGAPEG